MLGFRRSRHRLTTAAAVFGLLVAGAAVQASAAAPAAAATPHRILFDNAHAETAGNADWIISTSQPDPLGQDSSPSVRRPTGPEPSPPGVWPCRRPATTAWTRCLRAPA
jgi:hypothetical protein